MTANSGTSGSSLLRRWIRRTALGLQLFGLFSRELLVANLDQARLVLGRPSEIRPRWVRFETHLQTASARTVLGALISLTPGTLTCDLEGKTLLIHALNASSDEEAVASIRRRFESLLARMEAA
jgi:multicomponent K+:H+ antiporter subunit E